MVDINSVLDSNTMHLLPAAIKEKKKEHDRVDEITNIIFD